MTVLASPNYVHTRIKCRMIRLIFILVSFEGVRNGYGMYDTENDKQQNSVYPNNKYIQMIITLNIAYIMETTTLYILYYIVKYNTGS